MAPVGLSTRLNPQSRAPRPLLVLSAILLLSGVLLHIGAGYSGGRDTSEHALGADDAYISYRYAVNFVNGEGLVWNPGERVEGYTNLLFVLLSACLLLVTDQDYLYLGISVLNVGASLLAFTLFYRHLARSKKQPHPELAALLFAVSPTLWLWTASGMETPLVFLIQVGLWTAVDRLLVHESRRQVWAVAALLSCCALLRADGFVWVAITLAFLIIRGHLGSALRVAASVGPVIGAVFLWRIWYYGELLPNTYYAKVDEPLLTRLTHASVQFGEVLMSIGLAPYFLVFLFSAWRMSRRSTGSQWRARFQWPFGTFFAISLSAYWILAGGDAYAERFLIVLFPLGIAIFLELFAHLDRSKLVLLAAIQILWQVQPLLEDPRFAYTGNRYDAWVTLGHFLANEVDPDSLLATDAAGKIPYFSGLDTIDMRGLTNRHIARLRSQGSDVPGHRKWDADYVLQLEPRYVSAWVLPNLDLVVGLERSRYLPAGYRLQWLLNTSRIDRGSNVVDVSSLTDYEVRLLIARGYRYGVLSRSTAGDDF